MMQDNGSLNEEKGGILSSNNEQKLVLTYYKKEEEHCLHMFSGRARKPLSVALVIAAELCEHIEQKLKNTSDSQQMNEDSSMQARKIAEDCFNSLLQTQKLNNLSEAEHLNRFKQHLNNFGLNFISSNTNALHALVKILLSLCGSLRNFEFNRNDFHPLLSVLGNVTPQEKQLGFFFFCLMLVNRSIFTIQKKEMYAKINYPNNDFFKERKFLEQSLGSGIVSLRCIIYAFKTYCQAKLLERNSQEAYKSIYTDEQLSNLIKEYESKGRSMWIKVKVKVQGNGLDQQAWNDLDLRNPVIGYANYGFTEQYRQDRIKQSVLFDEKKEEAIEEDVRSSLIYLNSMIQALIGSLVFYEKDQMKSLFRQGKLVSRTRQRKKVFCLLELLAQHFEFCAFMEELIKYIEVKHNLATSRQSDLSLLQGRLDQLSEDKEELNELTVSDYQSRSSPSETISQSNDNKDETQEQETIGANASTSPLIPSQDQHTQEEQVDRIVLQNKNEESFSNKHAVSQVETKELKASQDHHANLVTYPDPPQILSHLLTEGQQKPTKPLNVLLSKSLIRLNKPLYPLNGTVSSRNEEKKEESVEVDSSNKTFPFKTIIGCLMLGVGLLIALAFIIPQFRAIAFTLIPGHAALGAGLLAVLAGALFVAGGALLVMQFNNKSMSCSFITALNSQLTASQIDDQIDPAYRLLRLSSCEVVTPSVLCSSL